MKPFDLSLLKKFVNGPVHHWLNNHANQYCYPAGLIEEMKQLGLFGANVSTNYNGLGLCYKQIFDICSELSYGWVSLSSILGSHLKVCGYLLHFGTDQQKEQWLPKLSKGDIIAAHALTEATGKSLQYFKTILVNESNQLYLNGNKSYVTNAAHAGLFAVVAKNTLKNHASVVLVEKNMKGLIIGPDIPRLGTTGISLCPITLEKCHIDEKNIIGGLACNAMTLVESTKTIDLLNYSARAQGIARAVYDHILQFIQSKQSGDHFLKDVPQTQLKIADIKMRLMTIEMVLAQAIDQHEKNTLSVLAAATTKAFTSESVVKIIKKALNLYGGAGYTAKFTIERLLRDALSLCIIGSPTELIQAQVREHIFQLQR